MKKILACCVLFIATFATAPVSAAPRSEHHKGATVAQSKKTVHVRSYTRKDGTVVRA